MRKMRLEVSPGAAFLAAALFFFLRGRELMALLTAILAHELGHVVAILALGLRLRRFRAEPGGFRLDYAGEMTPLGHVLIAAAGPAAGFLYAAFTASLWRETGQDWLCLSAGLSLLLSVFNLLPAPPLDGGRILAPLLNATLGSRRGEQLGRFLGYGVGLSLCVIGIVFASQGKGAAPLLPGLWLLLREEEGGGA